MSDQVGCTAERAPVTEMATRRITGLTERLHHRIMELENIADRLSGGETEPDKEVAELQPKAPGTLGELSLSIDRMDEAVNRLDRLTNRFDNIYP